MNIPFNKTSIPKNLDDIFSKSIKNGWLTTGPLVNEFETELKKYLNSDNVIAVNSCTAALHLALAAKKYGEGDKFIVPTYTFVATVETGEYLGMEPILIDCVNDYNMDLNQLEDLLKNDSSIKCIMPVHFAGKTVDMSELTYLSQKFGTFIIEDAAHALEAISNIGKVGDTDHAAAFSFYANKNITTGGEGGAVSTNDPKYASIIRKLSLHGMSKDGWKRFSKGGKWMYDISELGYKYNMTDLAASFGLWQFKKIKSWHNKRRNIFTEYNKKFDKIEGLITPNTDENIVSAFHLYIIRIKPELWNIDRNSLIMKLNESGIGTSVHYIPVHMHSYYKNKYGYKALDFPNAKHFSDNVITLPLYPLLDDAQIDFITSTLTSLWKEYRK